MTQAPGPPPRRRALCKNGQQTFRAFARSQGVIELVRSDIILAGGLVCPPPTGALPMDASNDAETPSRCPLHINYALSLRAAQNIGAATYGNDQIAAALVIPHLIQPELDWLCLNPKARLSIDDILKNAAHLDDLLRLAETVARAVRKACDADSPVRLRAAVAKALLKALRADQRRSHRAAHDRPTTVSVVLERRVLSGRSPACIRGDLSILTDADIIPALATLDLYLDHCVAHLVCPSLHSQGGPPLLRAAVAAGYARYGKAVVEAALVAAKAGPLETFIPTSTRHNYAAEAMCGLADIQDDLFNSSEGDTVVDSGPITLRSNFPDNRPIGVEFFYTPDGARTFRISPGGFTDPRLTPVILASFDAKDREEQPQVRAAVAAAEGKSRDKETKYKALKARLLAHLSPGHRAKRAKGDLPLDEFYQAVDDELKARISAVIGQSYALRLHDAKTDGKVRWDELPQGGLALARVLHKNGMREWGDASFLQPTPVVALRTIDSLGRSRVFLISPVPGGRRRPHRPSFKSPLQSSGPARRCLHDDL